MKNIIKIALLIVITILFVVNNKQNKKIKDIESYAGDWKSYCATNSDMEELEDEVGRLNKEIHNLKWWAEFESRQKRGQSQMNALNEMESKGNKLIR